MRSALDPAFEHLSASGSVLFACVSDDSRPARTARALISLEQDPRKGQAPRGHPPSGDARRSCWRLNFGHGHPKALLQHPANVRCTSVTGALGIVSRMTSR